MYTSPRTSRKSGAPSGKRFGISFIVAKILRYVFPHNAVAPGAAPNKNTIPVFQADGEARSIFASTTYCGARPASRIRAVPFPDFIQ